MRQPEKGDPKSGDPPVGDASAGASASAADHPKSGNEEAIGAILYRHWNSKKAAIGFAVTAIVILGFFIAVAYFEQPEPDGVLIIGYLGVLLALLIYPLVKLSDRSVKVEIGEHGFRDLRISQQSIPWCAIEDAKIVVTRQPGRAGTRHFEGIGLTLASPWRESFKASVMSRVATIGARATASESLNLWIGVDELDTTPAELLEELLKARNASGNGGSLPSQMGGKVVARKW